MPEDACASRPPIRIHLLGSLRIERAGAFCPLKYQKSRILLAWLALNAGQRYSRDWLAEWLWPEEAATVGRRRLKRCLFELREIFAQALESGRDHICLHVGGELWVDARIFGEHLATLDAAGQPSSDGLELLEWLESTVGLYGGGFIEGVQSDSGNACDRWVQDCREHYRQKACRLYERLAEGFSRHGDQTRALAYSRRLTREEPWNESAWQRLIGLLIGYGHRQEAQNALARCRAALAEELDAEPGSATLALLQTPELPPAPERRWMTVLCCRLCGPDSTDPDDWLALQEPTSRCLRLLGEAGALVRRTATDDLLAYFGYPQAMEGAARRALLAALDCQRIAGAPAGIVCALHSGETLSLPEDDVPDIGGRLTRPALGLADLGLPGQILVTQATAERLPVEHFDMRPLGPIRLSGGSEPSPVWLVAGHYGPPPADSEPPLGRTDELQSLTELWRKACSGEGLGVLVSGEAGIGKSRLLRFFRQSLALPGVSLTCRQESAMTPLHPFLHWLQRLPTPKDEAGQAAFERLHQLLDASRSTPASAHDIREQLLDLLQSQVPPGGIICVDDAHWADPMTRELLGRLIQHPLPARLLLIGTRDALNPTRDATAGVAHLHLQALSDEASAALVGRLLGQDRLDAPSVKQITGICAGVPLFIEEMTRTVLASRDGGNASPALPFSLRELMTAHIDGLGQAKPVAQLAAAFDGSFSAELLAVAAELEPATLAALLLPLRQQRLIVAADGQELQFRHALLRDAAYQSMPRSRQRWAHGRILASLLRLHPEMAVEDPAHLAWHSEHAGQPQAARGHLLAAGRQAALRSAYREALEHYRHGLALLDEAAEASEELQLRMAMAAPLAILDGNGAQTCRDNFDRAMQLAEPLGDDPQLFPAHWGLWLGSSSWHGFPRSERIARTLIRLAQQADDPDLLAHGYYALGNSLHSMGRFHEAAATLRQAGQLPLAAMKPLRFGEDARANGLSFLALSLWFCGRFAEAFEVSGQALRRARSLDSAYVLSQSLSLAALLGQASGDAAYVEGCAREGLEIARRHGIALWELACSALLGWSQAARGDARAIAPILEICAAVSPVMGGSAIFFQAVSADALWRADRLDGGLEVIERGLEVSERYAGHYAVAELQRLKSECLSRRGDAAGVGVVWLERALATALGQDSPPLILRATESLLAHRPDDRKLLAVAAAARKRLAGPTAT